MKGLSRLAIIFVIIAMTIALLKYVEEKGAHTMLNVGVHIDSVQFLTPIEENLQELNSDYQEDGGFGGRYFTRTDDSLLVVYSGYPDVRDDWKLTQVRIYDPPYSVFELSVTTSIDKVVETMEQKNYNLEIIGSKYYYTKGDIEIVFRTDYDDTVSSINIEFKATNKDEIVY